MRPAIFYVLFIQASLVASVQAQEICGLQNAVYPQMLKDGFENVGTPAAITFAPAVKTSKVITLGPALTMAPVPNGSTPPTISISEPLSGAVIEGRRVQVRGTYTGPAGTGVSVNGLPAILQGNQFVIREMILPLGATMLDAKATTIGGLTATATRAVSANSNVPSVQWRANKLAEFTSVGVDFQTTIAASILVQSISVDFNGDGTPEFSGSNPSLLPSHFDYVAPGVYTAKLTVVTQAPSSQTITATQIIAVVDLAAYRTRICSTYGYLRDRLNASDVSGALLAFPTDRRSSYQPFFNALGTNRPAMAARLGTIANGTLTFNSAKLMVVRINGAQVQGYPLQITQSNDGVWRIDQF
jgi:PKD repeat protein